MPSNKPKKTALPLRLFKRRPSRKYPIKRDADGRSLRQRAFTLFGEGKGPAEVAKALSAKLKTIYRYHVDWKKPGNRAPYADLKKELEQDPQLNEGVISMLMRTLGMSREEVILRLQRPWGLKTYLKGERPNRGLEIAQSEIEDRLEAALRLIRISELLGNDLGQVKEKLDDLLLRGGKDGGPLGETDEEPETLEEVEGLTQQGFPPTETTTDDPDVDTNPSPGSNNSPSP